MFGVSKCILRGCGSGYAGYATCILEGSRQFLFLFLYRYLPGAPCNADIVAVRLVNKIMAFQARFPVCWAEWLIIDQ
jgi:hypothetical protein